MARCALVEPAADAVVPSAERKMLGAGVRAESAAGQAEVLGMM